MLQKGTKKKLKRMLSKNSILYFDVDKNYKNTIILAGSGRSGTTWVSNIINYRNDYRYIFEPFHSYKVRTCKLFNYRQYMRPNSKNKLFLEAAEKILSGKIRNYWVDSQNKRFISYKRLIKDIRVNLLLKWINSNFPEIPIVLLLRHPCAVAISKLELKWDNQIRYYLDQEDLMEDYLLPFEKVLKNANSIFEKHILEWCIENYIPLKQFNKEEICIAFYENLCLTPDEEIDKIFSYLKVNYDKLVLKQLLQPSSRSRQGSAIETGGSLVNNWKKSITKLQLKRAVEILSVFGLNNLYNNSSIPSEQAICNLMKK